MVSFPSHHGYIPRWRLFIENKQTNNKKSSHFWIIHKIGNFSTKEIFFHRAVTHCKQKIINLAYLIITLYAMPNKKKALSFLLSESQRIMKAKCLKYLLRRLGDANYFWTPAKYPRAASAARLVSSLWSAEEVYLLGRTDPSSHN